MKMVKIFEFEVSNASRALLAKDASEQWAIDAKGRLVTPSQMESIINGFAKNYNVIDIVVSTIDAKYHNNGRGNTIFLIYTIVYEV